MPFVDRFISPPSSPLLLVPFILSIALLILSLASCLLHLRLSAASFTTPLWPVRLLLSFFASLWALSHLFLSCHTSVIVSQALSQPAFLSLLYFLIRSSTHPSNSPPLSNFIIAFLVTAVTAIPILSLHALIPYIPGPEFIRIVPIQNYHDGQCTHPFLATVLLAVFCAAYVPLFLNAALVATVVVINKRLKARIYGLIIVVIGALLVQVVALALSALWRPGEQEFRWLSMIAVAAFVVLAAAAEVVLVVWPVIDALAVGHAEHAEERWSEAEDEEQGIL